MANSVPRRTQPTPTNDRDRPNSYQRGYGGRWQASSKGWLSNNPLCAMCKRQGQARQADCVDHVRPHRGDMGVFWDVSNWQSLCKLCHDRKTRMEDNIGKHTRTVISGPLGCGKTTYVNQRKFPGDLVWDWDCVVKEMTGLPMYQTPSDLIPIVNAMAETMIEAIASAPPKRNCWLIFSNEQRAAAIAERISGTLVVLKEQRKS